MGFVVREEEEEEVVGEEYRDSDTDDDDDVDRYVFLARQPAPAEASDDDDVDGDDDDAMLPGGGGGGGLGPKRGLMEILDAPAPSAKKARLDLTSGSGTVASSQCGARAGDYGSVEAVAARFTEREGDQKAKGRKRGRCGGDPQVQVRRAARGKRSRVADCDAGRDAAEAQNTAAAAAGGSRRFHCGVCGRCFGSHQALGGHVLGHRKRAKKGIAAASHEVDADGGNGHCNDETASQEEGADGAGNGEEKAVHVVAASLGRAADGDGNRDGKKTVHVAACHEDVDGSGHGHGKAGKASAVAANHDHKGFYDNGNEVEDDVIAAIHERANDEKAIGAENHDDHNGDGGVKEEEKVTVAPRQSNADGNGTEKKLAAVGRCHNKLATGKGHGNSIARKSQHRCEVCGKECPTGQALGGNMRKHQTRPAHGGEGGSARPAPEDDGDTQPPPARVIGAEICLERAVVITGE